MNRRGFLGLLASVAVLDPERLLWVPGRKTISIPSPQILTTKEVTFAMLDILLPKLLAATKREQDKVLGRFFAANAAPTPIPSFGYLAS